MDNTKPIRLYQNCSELPMYNFDLCRKDSDPKWLVYGYDGWGEVTVPEGVEKVWDDITNEFAVLTSNNSTMQYFDLCADESDMRIRIEMVNALLWQIETRPNMKDEIFKGYCNELRRWRFYFNESKDKAQEIKRLKKQLEVVQSKLKLLLDDKENFEKKNKSSDLLKIKVSVQNILKRDIDLKKISVKEWILTLDNLPKTA